MHKSNLEPTYENIQATFCSNRLNRQDMVFEFINMLDSIDENYTIAVDGSWGSGKTFFIKQITMVLETLNNASDVDSQHTAIINKYYSQNNTVTKTNIPIYFDAWANDNDDDPLLSLLYSILQNSSIGLQNLKDWNSIFFNIIKRFAPSPISKIMETYSDCKGVNILEAINHSHEIKSMINAFFEKLSHDTLDTRVVMFVDELDRCKPDYAIKLLERIKHFFIHQKITFVFSTNLTELEQTIKQYYGINFNGYQYLEKFFDFIYTLPLPTQEELTPIYSISRETRMTDIAQSFIKVYNVPLRQALKIMAAIIKFTNNLKYHSSENKFQDFQNGIFIPILICLKHYNIQKYNEFIEGKNSSALIDVCFNKNISFPPYRSALEYLFEKRHTPTEDEIKTKYLELYELIFQNKVITSKPITVGQVIIYADSKQKILKKMK